MVFVSRFAAALQTAENLKRIILEKSIRFYTIDAVHIAEKIGLGRRINMIMQTAFFALTQIIPVEKAVEYLKAEVKKNYGHQGQKVIDMNFDAIEEALKHIHKVDLRLLCRESGEERKQEICTGDADTDFFVNNIMVPMNRQKGDNLPVSVFSGREDGTFPTAVPQLVGQYVMHHHSHHEHKWYHPAAQGNGDHSPLDGNFLFFFHLFFLSPCILRFLFFQTALSISYHVLSFFAEKNRGYTAKFCHSAVHPHLFVSSPVTAQYRARADI